MLLTSLVAAALYLVGPFVFVTARWSRGRAVDQVGFLIPAGVAADLLLVLLLTRLMRLDAAVVTSRILWLAIACGAVLRRRRPRPFDQATRADALVMAAAALLALGLSIWLSRRYAIWDRQWHIPLVTSLRGQRVPFVNVYQPGLHLGYHVSGDVLGAMLQVLSGARLHASLALSLVHDLMFMLIAVSLSSLLLPGVREPTRGRFAFAAVAPLAVLLAGPPIIVGEFFTGYSFMSYYQMSYRPHVVLAGLLIVGLVGAVVAPILRRHGDPERPLLPPLDALLLMVALLAITDEPSALVATPALALLALTLPAAERRPLPRVLLAGSVAGAWALALLILPSTARGGPHLPISLAAPRLPSFFGPSLPLSSLHGLGALAKDLSPLLAIAAVLGIVAARSRRRDLAKVFVFAGGILVVSALLLTCVVVAGTPAESHRFMTLPELTLPLVALFAFEAVPPLARAALAAPIMFSMACSVAWAIHAEPTLKQHFRIDGYAQGIHQVDCRATSGARLFEQVQPTYVPRTDWYLWAGCHPLFAPGGLEGEGAIVDVHRPLFERNALAVLDRTFAGPNDDVVAACSVNARDDRVCRFALEHATCQQSGSAWQRCILKQRERATLLDTWRP